MAVSRAPSGPLVRGGVRLAAVAAHAGTPTYAYDLDAIAAEARSMQAAFADAPHLVAYAVKANSAGAVVRTLAEEGCGADAVSGAALGGALGSGAVPEKIVSRGVAKTDAHIY